MILIENNFKENLDKIADDLTLYSNLSRVELFNQCLKEKLNNLLLDYNEELDKKISWLANIDPKRVIRAINKIDRKNDKEIIKENLKK